MTGPIHLRRLFAGCSVMMAGAFDASVPVIEVHVTGNIKHVFTLLLF